MDFLTIWSFLGFLFAVYAVTANDSIQTLGTYIASNRARFELQKESLFKFVFIHLWINAFIVLGPFPSYDCI